MIEESSYWKEDLLSRARRLKWRSHRKEWSDVGLARIEQDLVLGFYSVRKLLDSHKTSDSVASRLIPMRSFPAIREPTSFLDTRNFDQFYDLEDPVSDDRDLRFVCNLTVHSFIFCPYFEYEGEFLGLFLNSDRTKNELLFELRVEDVLAAFEAVGRDYPAELELRRGLHGETVRVDNPRS